MLNDDNFTGEKFDRALTTTQISTLFREDVKRALKAGTLPKGLKLSVRTEYYSMGSSIHANITAYPYSDPRTSEYLAYLQSPQVKYAGFDGQRFTDQAKALLVTLNAMLDAYNRDASDSRVDYFERRFYGEVKFSYDLVR